MARKSKKIKSTIDILKEKGIVGTPVDLDPNWYTKHLEEERKAKEEARKKEEERIENIECPCCASNLKEHIIKSNNNGIIGPGYRSWETESYFVCKICGVMFKDIEKFKE